jgi:hypothetical protein
MLCFWGTITLFCVFSGAQAWSLSRGGTHSCHCFGTHERIGVISLGRSLALALIAISTVVLTPVLDPLVDTPHGGLEICGLSVLALILAILVAQSQDLIAAAERAIRLGIKLRH